MCWSFARRATPAQAAERAGDALVRQAIHDHRDVVDALEEDILALIESSPERDRFDLYRTYNQLMGTWVQIDLSDTLVEQAALAMSPSEEEEIRTTLRDQAQFALWELDDALAYLEQIRPGTHRHEYLRIKEAIRSLLETKTVINGLLAAQCDYLRCATVPDHLPESNVFQPNGGCLCGPSGIASPVSPARSLCHCPSSPFAAGASCCLGRGAQAEFSVASGEPKAHESSPGERTFCAMCGSALTYRELDAKDNRCRSGKYRPIVVHPRPLDLGSIPPAIRLPPPWLEWE